MGAITYSELVRTGVAKINILTSQAEADAYILDLSERGYKYSRTATRCGYIPRDIYGLTYEYNGQWGNGYCIALYNSGSTVQLNYYIMRCNNGKNKKRYYKNRH